ncbi:MAG: hypothetical protein NTV74_01380 [Euryarchaeota archaeon]|nr:hypothetical protein [Euryarchaeota archaeon]
MLCLRVDCAEGLFAIVVLIMGIKYATVVKWENASIIFHFING